MRTELYEQSKEAIIAYLKDDKTCVEVYGDKIWRIVEEE